jgi:hypothetical protein
MILRGATSLLRALEGVGPENRGMLIVNFSDMILPGRMANVIYHQRSTLEIQKPVEVLI